MRKFAVALLKVVIVAGCALYIYSRLLSLRMSDGLMLWTPSDWLIAPHWVALLMLLLASFNWYGEAQKWRTLFKDEYPQTLLNALNAVFIALAGGILTPGKVGEYGMRAMLVPHEVRWLAVGRQWLNTYGQTLISSFIGGLPAAYYLSQLPNSPSFITWAYLAAFVLLQYPGYLLYRNGGAWLARLTPTNWAEWIHRIPSGSQLRTPLLHQNLAWAVFRYVAYSASNTLIWYAMGLHPDLLLIFCIVQANFILSIFIPVASLLSLVVRSGTAIALAEPFGIAPNGVLLAIFINWIFQTALPLIIGAILLLKHPVKTKAS